MDENGQQTTAEEWGRPTESTVPVEPAPYDSRRPETVTGDPVDVQDWDHRLWRRV
jgi:hypothetical protein